MACVPQTLISANACLTETSGAGLRNIMFGAIQNWAGSNATPASLIASNPCLMELSGAGLRAVIFGTLCNILGGSSQCADTDAANFLTTTGITDSTTTNAICTLVSSLKSAGVWALMDAIYPFVGGTSTICSYNLKNPAQYQITWHGAVTFAASGITGDGSTGYGDTGFNPATAGGNYTASSATLAVYMSGASSSGTVLGSGSEPTNKQPFAFIGWASATQVDYGGPNGNTTAPRNITSVKGFALLTQTNATTATYYTQDGNTGTYSNPIASSLTLPTVDFYVLATNAAGAAAQFTAQTLSFAAFGGTLTITQATAMANAVIAFETALSRN